MIALLLAAVLAGDVDGPGVRRLVEARRGRPVVLTLWATWCAPCVKEFPDLIALAQKHRDTAFVAVSLDEVEDRASVEAFVAERRPPFPVYLKAPGKDDAFIENVDREWAGALPTTLVFDRDGKRVALLQGEAPVSEIARALAQLKP